MLGQRGRRWANICQTLASETGKVKGKQKRAVTTYYKSNQLLLYALARVYRQTDTGVQFSSTEISEWFANVTAPFAYTTSNKPIFLCRVYVTYTS